MKNLFLFVFFVAYASFAIAQDNDSTALQRKNVVKFLPIDYFLNSYSFEYERMINANNSFTIGVGLPNRQNMDGKYGIHFTSDLKSIEFETMHIRAAYRHYAGQRRLPKGFYIEPYLKYQKITGKIGASFSKDANTTYTGNFDVNLNSMNFGFQLGAQFLIAKRVSLDFYFLGLEAGLLNGNVSGTSEQFATDDNIVANIQEAINELPSFIGDKLKPKKNGNTINIKASNAPCPWFRSGISIGIAF